MCRHNRADAPCHESEEVWTGQGCLWEWSRLSTLRPVRAVSMMVHGHPSDAKRLHIDSRLDVHLREMYDQQQTSYM